MVQVSNIFNDGCRTLTERTQIPEYWESWLAAEYGCLKSRSPGREAALCVTFLCDFLCTEENQEY